MIKSSSTFVATVASGVFSLQVRAQSIDYGALQQLFGEPLTTSATGSPLRQNDVPANMEIITQDDIRRSGADNIPDILQFVAGIDVRRYGAAQSEVAVRGYDQPWSPRLLVLINGRQVYIDEYGYTAWQTLPVQLNEIRQIEVVKGPNSALFGLNAAAGVINIITFDPLTDSTNAATASVGTNGYRSGSAVGTVRLDDRGGVRLSASGSRSDEFSTAGLIPSTVFYFHTPAQFYDTPYHYDLSADGRFKATPEVEFIAEATATKSRDMEVVTIPVFVPSSTFRTNSAKLGVVADTSFGLLDARAYRNESRGETEIGGPVVLRAQNVVYVAQASDLFKAGTRNTVRLGIEYRNDSAVGNIRSGTIGYKDYAANGMWHWQISPNMTLTNAIRYDYTFLYFSGFVPPDSRYTVADYSRNSFISIDFNSGLVYEATDADTIRLTLARGAELPSLLDVGLQTVINLGAHSLSFIGNPDMNPARITNYEVDYDRTISALHATLRIAAYYQKTTDLLVSPLNAPVVPGSGGLVAYAQNAGTSEAYGGEIGLKGTAASGPRWSASYAYLSISDHTGLAGLGGFTTALDYAHGTPASVVKFGVGYSRGRMEADLQGKWQSHFTDYGVADDTASLSGVVPFPIGSYFTANARIGYALTDHMTLAVSGQNLTHSSQRQTAGPEVERRVMATLRLQL